MTSDSSSDRQLLRESVERYAERAISPHLDALNHYPLHELPKGVLEGISELGLLGIEPDANGAHAELYGVAFERLAATCAAPAALVFGHALAREIVHLAGATLDATLGEALLGFPAYGEARSPALGVELRAEAGGIRLDGEASFVVGAPLAGGLVLPVADVENAGELALVLVKAGTPGLRVGEPLLTLGMRGCPVADVHLEGVSAPRTALLASAPGASQVLQTAYRRMRGPALAIAAGILEQSLGRATSYAEERYQAGSAIIEHQQVRSLLVDVMADFALVKDAAERLCRSPRGGPADAALFLKAKEAAARATTDGVQLLGGNGYMEDYGQERCMRDARQAQCLLGRTDVLRQDLMDEWLSAGATPASAFREIAP